MFNFTEPEGRGNLLTPSSAPVEHRYPASFEGNGNVGSSWVDGKQQESSCSGVGVNDGARSVFYSPAGLRVRGSAPFNCRFGLRKNILCGNAAPLLRWQQASHTEHGHVHRII